MLPFPDDDLTDDVIEEEIYDYEIEEESEGEFEVSENEIPDANDFESAYKKLAELTDVIEKGGLSFNDAIDKFEEGMRLVKQCNQMLDNAELRITSIRDEYTPPEHQQRGRQGGQGGRQRNQ